MPLFTRTYKERYPIQIQAALITVENIHEVADWCMGRVQRASVPIDGGYLPPMVIKLRTKNRLKLANIGDYIYKDHEDYFHVSDRDSFHFKYEPTEIWVKEN